MIAPFAFLARQGRFILLAGLALGAALPDVALAMRPLIPAFPAVLLFLAALRIGPGAAALVRTPLLRPVAAMFLMQLALPMAVVGLSLWLGWSGPLVAAVTVMAAAPALAGSPNLTQLAGGDPVPALRMVVITTAAVPLTAPLVFLLAPGLGDAATVTAAAGRLFLVIGGSVAAGVGLSLAAPALRRSAALTVVDGLSVLSLAGMVIGLMSAVGPALRTPDLALAVLVTTAFAANFGLQIAGWMIGGAFGFGTERTAYAVVAGNRNIALFLAALPPAVAEPLLGFIGFYQIPMFLTPLLLGALGRREAMGRGTDRPDNRV
jgi:predicted Na+-dependent transporter